VTTTEATELPEVCTADAPHVEACAPQGAAGADHDYRVYVTNPPHGRSHTYLRCVWCHVVSCGNATETDPCIEPYHHRVPHRTGLGRVTPIGGGPDTDS
jgi:hypothetical protein